MAILPNFTTITFSGSLSGSIFCSEVGSETLFIPYDRKEFSHARLRTAPTSTGALPIIQTGFGGQPLQIAILCTNDSPRPLTPDTASNLIYVKQMQKIQRYTLSGGISASSTVDAIESLSLTHIEYLSQFEYQQYSGNEAELSYSDLITQQSNTYAFLTTSGLSVSGNAIGGTLSNVILRAFKSTTTHEFTNLSSSVVYRGVDLTLDVITLESLSL